MGVSRTKYGNDPFYQSSEWRALRNAFLVSNPTCKMCWDKNRIVEPAKVVDHIIPRMDNIELELDWDNLQSLCDPCHRFKTRLDDRRRRYPHNKEYQDSFGK